jgi:predicted phosphoadenosine phosphosulfate sulfurtransferase
VRRKIASYISSWKRKGYSSGIPDEADSVLEAMNKAPSYRAICRAILRNDIALTTLGYSRPKTDAYMALKRIELDERLRSSEAADIEGV